MRRRGLCIYKNYPPPDSKDTIVAVAAAGICGSDMHAFFGHDERRPPPLILGHEFSGEVDGEKVVVNPLAVCGACIFCRGGRSNLCEMRQNSFYASAAGGVCRLCCRAARKCFVVAAVSFFATRRACRTAGVRASCGGDGVAFLSGGGGMHRADIGRRRNRFGVRIVVVGARNQKSLYCGGESVAAKCAEKNRRFRRYRAGRIARPPKLS